jgi:gas vesicle protein
MENFIGKDGFVWWVGQVEATNDPLQLGRARCRIFGWHSENTADIKTENLPWAQPLLPLNGTKSFSTPLEGEYVVGFFGDGMSGQFPIMLGAFSWCIPGVPDSTTSSQNTTINVVTTPTSNVNPIKTDLPAGQSVGGPGQPTTVPLARGNVANTHIANTNANLAHACDFRYNIKIDMGIGGIINPVTAIQQAIKNGKNKAAQLIRMLLGQLTDQLRAAIKAIIAAANLDPSGEYSKTMSLIKDAIRKINDLTKKIAKYVEEASFYISLVQDINLIVNYLKSLPATVLAIIQQCIANFLGGVQNTVNQIKGIATATTNSLAAIGASTSTPTTTPTVDPNTIAAINSLNSVAQTALSVATSNTSTANSAADITNILNTANSNTYILLSNYIIQNTPNTSSIQANSSSNTYTTITLRSSP